MSPDDRRPFVIFNPASGRGAGAKRLDEYLAHLRRHFGDFPHAGTSYAGEEARLHQVGQGGAGSGAWSYIALRRPFDEYAGRPAAASPATGFLAAHKVQQDALVRAALGL